MTSIPASVHTATVPAALKSTSSGWAAITRIRRISESLSTVAILSVSHRPTPARPPTPRHALTSWLAQPRHKTGCCRIGWPVAACLRVMLVTGWDGRGRGEGVSPGGPGPGVFVPAGYARLAACGSSGVAGDHGGGAASGHGRVSRWAADRGGGGGRL